MNNILYDDVKVDLIYHKIYLYCLKTNRIQILAKCYSK